MQVGFTHSNQGDSQEVSVSNHEFYFKEENNELIISENGGSIRAQIDDDCLILKVIQKIPHAILEEASLQEGSTYFMEIGEKLSYKDSTYELKTLDTSSPIPEPTITQNDEIAPNSVNEDLGQSPSLSLENEESHNSIQFEDADDDESNEKQAKEISESKETPDSADSPDSEDESDVENSGNGYSFQLDTNLAQDTNEDEEKDSGTMSITQVLNVARLQEDEKQASKKDDEHVSRPLKKKSKKKAKKKSGKKKSKNASDSGLAITTARDYKGNRAKRDSKKKARSRSKLLNDHKLVGPFTRFLSALSLMFVTVLLSAQVENEAVNSLSNKGTEIINTQIAKFVDFSFNPEITKSLIVLFIILFISNLLFSVSPTLFICGATTKGSFLTKRAKAILRTPFDFIAHFFPIFETPVIFDTPSLKEIITRGPISYRLRAFRYIPLVTLSIFTFICVGYPIIEQGLSNSNPPEKINIPKNLGKRPLKMKELLISKQFSQENIILRIPATRPSYFIINKKSGRSLYLKNTSSTFFASFKKTLETIPFFKYRYPYLSSFLKDEKSSFLVREDFSKILWGGEIIKGMATEDLMYLDFLAIDQSKKIFNYFKFPYIEYRNLNKFTSFYRSKVEDVYLYINDNSLMQFAKVAGTMRSSELSGFTFLARPKVRIEYVDAVEKAFKGTNDSFLIKELKDIQSIIAVTDNGENRKAFRDFTQYLVEYFKASGNESANRVATQILNLNILSN